MENICSRLLSLSPFLPMSLTIYLTFPQTFSLSFYLPLHLYLSLSRLPITPPKVYIIIKTISCMKLVLGFCGWHKER